jgi:hypothetical protein
MPSDKVSHLMENLKRRKEWTRKLDAQAQAFYGVKSWQSALPGLGIEEVRFLKRYAIQEFLDGALLGREEMALLERHLLRSLDEFGRDQLVVAVARTYARAIKRAAGDYADMLAQVLLSRSGRARLAEKTRMSICREVMEYSDTLSTPASHDSWAEKTQAPVFPAGRAPFEDRERAFFWERMRIYRSDWIREADNRISLRLLLAGGREPQVRTNPFRRAIARLIVMMLNSTDRAICLEMDRQNERALNENHRPAFPVPKSFERNGVRLWADAFETKRAELIQDVHELLSRVRREFGLRKTDPLPDPLPIPPKMSLDAGNSSSSASDDK